MAYNLRCRIDSNIKILEAFHSQFDWIPGSDDIRPTKELLAQKIAKKEEILSLWKSTEDYILNSIFSKPIFIR
jgi:hypothetical protein